MEINTIIGIVVAVIICIVGLRMILRKPNEAAPSLETELHINQDCNKPIIPRHVRDQLQTDSTETDYVENKSAERIEPSFSEADQSLNEADSKTHAESLTEHSISTVSDAQLSSAVTPLKSETQPAVAAFIDVDDSKTESLLQSSLQNQIADSDQSAGDPQQLSQSQAVENTPLASDSTLINEDTGRSKILKEAEFTLNSNVQTAAIKDYEDESSILDVHLHEQQRFDDDSELAKAEHIISLNLYPNPRKALSGDKALKVLLKYGLRFGEMNCFHRYENPENVSPLMFSVLRITEEGPAGFDLEALSIEQVKGLAFFLALPHQNVQKGYDSMVSIAGLIARETDGTVYDENNLEFTPQLKEHWRHKAIDYRSGQEKS